MSLDHPKHWWRLSLKKLNALTMQDVDAILIAPSKEQVQVLLWHFLQPTCHRLKKFKENLELFGALARQLNLLGLPLLHVLRQHPVEDWRSQHQDRRIGSYVCKGIVVEHNGDVLHWKRRNSAMLPLAMENPSAWWEIFCNFISTADCRLPDSQPLFELKPKTETFIGSLLGGAGKCPCEFSALCHNFWKFDFCSNWSSIFQRTPQGTAAGSWALKKWLQPSKFRNQCRDIYIYIRDIYRD